MWGAHGVRGDCSLMCAARPEWEDDGFKRLERTSTPRWGTEGIRAGRGGGGAGRLSMRQVEQFASA